MNKPTKGPTKNYNNDFPYLTLLLSAATLDMEFAWGVFFMQRMGSLRVYSTIECRFMIHRILFK